MKQIKALLGLFLCAAFFYTAWKVVPPYLNDYEFQDAVGQIAREATFNHQITEDVIRERVAKKAAEFGIPLTQEGVHITNNGPEVVVTGDYVVHIDLPIHPFDMNFHVNSKRI